MLTIIHILPPVIEFPPIKYGGTERVAYELLKAQIEQYKKLQIMLNEENIVFKVFAKINKSSIQIINKKPLNFPIALEFFDLSKARSYYDYIVRVINVIKMIKKSQESKNKLIIHNHMLQRNSFVLLHLSSLGRNTITTLHYDPPFYKFFNLITSINFKGNLVAISKNQFQRLKPFLGSALYTFVHNGIPIEEFPFCGKKDDYFISINAITPAKGVHNAIILSKKAKTKLFLVGPIRDYNYFEMLRKYFDDKEVIYLGEIDEETKRKLLCRAKALLFPVEREEYFGLNMIEATASGTPVLAYSRGAVPEIVSHGVTGFFGSSIEELARYIKQLDSLKPETIRYYAKKFSNNSMALKYTALYKTKLRTM